MIGDRLKELRTDAKLNQVQFADIVGTSKQYVSQLEKGRNKDPNPKFIEGWARHFGVRMEWITSGKQPKQAAMPELTPDEDGWTPILGYAQAAGLGGGKEADEWAETHKLKFRRDSLSRKRLNAGNLRAMYGSGDSMEPTIHSGDAILFDMSDTTPRNRMIYVLLTDGAVNEEYNVKRAIVSKGEVTFVADNPYGDHDWKEPRPYDRSIKVVGRVRWIGRWV